MSQSLMSLTERVSFAPPTAINTPSGTDDAGELLAKVINGKVNVNDPLNHEVWGRDGSHNLSTLTRTVVRQLQNQPNVETAKLFLEVVTRSAGIRTQQLNESRTLGWQILGKGIDEDDGPLSASRWSEKDLSHIRMAASSVSTDDMPLENQRKLIFALASTHASKAKPGLLHNGFQLSVVDQLVGDFFDRSWRHEGFQTTPTLAADIERAIEVAPRVTLLLSLDPSAGPLMTRGNAERAMARMAAGDPMRERLGSSIPLDWMSTDEAMIHLREKPLNLQRLINYKNAEAGHTRVVLERILAYDFPSSSYVGLDLISRLPKIKELVDGAEWLLELKSQKSWDLHRVIRDIAALQTDPEFGHRLLVEYAKASVEAAKDEMVEDPKHPHVWFALQACKVFMGSNPKRPDLYAPLPKPLTMEDFTAIVHSTNFQFDKKHDCYRVGHDWTSMIQTAVDSLRLSAKERDGLMSICVETGAIRVAELSRSDLRPEVVGASVRNNPDLLLEVPDKGILKRLAKQLDIPVEPSQEAALAIQRRNRALATIHGGDSAPRRRRMPAV